MNVLVVGGAGYVGGAVTDASLTSEHRIRVYDALLYEESYRKPVDLYSETLETRTGCCPISNGRMR